MNGILLIYNRYWTKDASTVWDHINSFAKYSGFPVFNVNTAYGFPRSLKGVQFDIIILHYSLFGSYYLLDKNFTDYLENCRSSYKIAFFQDDFHYCRQRFQFINKFNINCIYTMLDRKYHNLTYGKYTKAQIRTTMTGYISDNLLKNAAKFSKPDSERTIDIGYRGRQIPFHIGKGAQEKWQIAEKFLQKSAVLNLKCDISYQEKDRLYGDDWYRFLGNQKGCLGVEAGSSIFDIDDIVRPECERLLAENPQMTLEEMSERLLDKWENNIPYRVVSPRHFEAAAFRVCQILYEGEYQGILKPFVHYIPLKKDFSNFDEVIKMFGNESIRHEIKANCHRDLIASGKYSYRTFIKGFDRDLIESGFTPKDYSQSEKRIINRLSLDNPFGSTMARLMFLISSLATRWKLRDSPLFHSLRWLYRRVFGKYIGEQFWTMKGE